MACKALRSTYLALLCLIASGCASSQIVPSTGPHAPTDPTQVKIYQEAPRKYEVIGTVEVPVGGEVRWDERGNAIKGFDQLRSKAAARGATGILLIEKGPGMARVTAGDGETFYQVPVLLGNPKVAVAQAIFVVEK